MLNLSLQGCMAVGKTTAVHYIRIHAPYINISYEDNSSVLEEIRSRQLKKNRYEDYIEIQRLWINNEIGRWNRTCHHSVSIMDFGAEEIEFYTVNYPKSIGADWDVEEALRKELSELRKCLPQRILFLDASTQTLRMRKQNDMTRSREFFDFYLAHMLELKKNWFFGRPNVDILKVDTLSKKEMGRQVKEWIDRQICFTA